MKNRLERDYNRSRDLSKGQAKRRKFELKGCIDKVYRPEIYLGGRNDRTW